PAQDVRASIGADRVEGEDRLADGRHDEPRRRRRLERSLPRAWRPDAGSYNTGRVADHADGLWSKTIAREARCDGRRPAPTNDVWARRTAVRSTGRRRGNRLRVETAGVLVARSLAVSDDLKPDRRARRELMRSALPLPERPAPDAERR